MNNKGLLIVAVIAAIIAAGCGSCALAPLYVPGVYTGSAYGYNGPVAVEVDVNNYVILDATVVESSEDEEFAEEAFAELRDRVLESGDTDVDAITGATISSEAFLHAIDDALDHAVIH
jgi:fumarate reductase flavoprotein subunit